MPYWLWTTAVPIWNDTIQQLEEMGILAQCDGVALASYCITVIKYIECQDVLENGSTQEIVTREGNKVEVDRPEVARSGKLREEIRKLEISFGLTPSARTALIPERETNRRENRGKKKPKGKSKERFFQGRIG